MDYAIQSGLFNEEALRLINYCQLYLHVTTVSELFNAGGTSMLPDMLSCRRAPWMDSTTIITIQKKPSDYQIRYRWKRLCREWCTDDGRVLEAIQLRQWLRPPQKLRLRRSTYIESGLMPILYHWIDNCYWEYLPDHSATQLFRPNRATRGFQRLLLSRSTHYQTTPPLWSSAARHGVTSNLRHLIGRLIITIFAPSRHGSRNFSNTSNL
jgi:hypothetical protein